MYKNKRILAIIPARGGSKGLPGKNVKMLCGKPLIAWSIEAAKTSKYIDEIMVSTDSQEIADCAIKFNCPVPILRPTEFATDESPMIDVVKHAIDYYTTACHQQFDYVVLVEPTAPLREKDDIDNMIKKLIDLEDKFDSIISLGEIQEHPSIVKKLNNDSMEPFCPELPRTARRQDNIPAYFPFGIAYIAKTSVLLKEETFYTERSTYYLIKPHQHCEIDNIYDFLLAETIIKHHEKVK